MNLYGFSCSIEEPLANYVYRKTFTKWQLETTTPQKNNDKPIERAMQLTAQKADTEREHTVSGRLLFAKRKSSCYMTRSMQLWHSAAQQSFSSYREILVKMPR